VNEPLLTQGGPTYRLQEALGLGGPRPVTRLWRSLIFATIAMGPLVVLAAAKGLALGPDPRRSLLLDYEVYARFIVAVAAFVFAEGAVDSRCAAMLREFIDTHLVPEGQRARFNAALERTVRLRDNPVPELVVLVLAYGRARAGIALTASFGQPTWWAPNLPDSASLSLPGWWYALVSLPLYQFLLLLWLWRLVIWTLLLRRIAQLDLQLRASHPDRMGGVGFLNLSLAPFGLVGFGYGASIGAVALQSVVHQHETIRSLAPFMAGSVVLGVAVFVVPLLMFMKPLVLCRRKAILEYTAFGARYTQLFERKWIEQRGSGPDPLGTNDVQSLADLDHTFAIVRQVRTIPIDPYAVIPLALAIAAPMIPAVVVAIGLRPLLQLILKSVL